VGKQSKTFILLSRYLPIAVFITVAFIGFSVKSFLKPTDIPYEGEISNLDIQDTVDVYFDEYGVPSIFASNDSDMFKVAGYVGARDRLFQMAFMTYAY